MGEWITSTKAPNEGKQYYRSTYPGDWPTDVEHPDAPQAMRQPFPSPCPRCGGRLWRWVSGNRSEVEFRHQRAVQAYRAGALPGPEPRPEPVIEWVCYRLDHFTECAAPRDLEAQGLGHSLRPRLRVAD
jgi:hypothetical protein